MSDKLKAVHLLIRGRDSTRHTVWLVSTRALSSPFQLRRWLAERPEIELLFLNPFSEAEKQRFLARLQEALPECKSWAAPYPTHRQRFFIARVLDEATILRHARQVTEAARDFERVARRCCLALATHLEVDVEDLIAQGRFLHPDFSDERQMGELEDGWRFFFHGFECGFSNDKTKQHLDVVFGYQNQFGVLDASFFEQFVRTTPAHSELNRLFQRTFADSQRTLEVLEDAGYLVRVPRSPHFFVQNPGLVVAPQEQVEALLHSSRQNFN